MKYTWITNGTGGVIGVPKITTNTQQYIDLRRDPDGIL